MSYGPPPHQYNQYPPPNQYPPSGHSPQPGYQQGAYPPNPNQYPPQQGYHQPPPQQQGYGQHPPQGYHQPPPPQHGYPPPQQGGYGQPQYGQGQGQYPPPQGYPPPQHGQYPPPAQGYGAPPPGGHAPPPHPPPAQYGAPPVPPHPNQQQQHGGHTAAPSPGYGGPITQRLPDPGPAAAELRRAMKGFGTDEKALIRVLAKYPAEGMPQLKDSFRQQYGRSLEDDIKKETSGYFEDGLLSILRGPLGHDVNTVRKALKGAGTNEALLNDVTLGRSNADLRAIKHSYQSAHNRGLEADVSSDLSQKTERMFAMALAGNREEESAPIHPQAIDNWVNEIHRATEAKAIGTDQLSVCSVLLYRSDAQIRAISQAHEHKYRKSLDKVFEKEFSGHMKEGLVAVVRKATNPALHTAICLEECMAGMGTKDEMLVARLVAAHWNPQYMAAVKQAYRQKYNKDLVSRVKGELSGDYEKLMVAMIE